jgi:hypothetical protein
MDVHEIKSRVSLREIMERDGVSFRKAGAKLLCCCPLHQEKTPSFYLSVKNGEERFRCFGCGEHGDVFEYLKLAHGLEFREAVERLGFGSGGGEYSGQAVTPRVVRPVEPETDAVPLTEEERKDWMGACMEFAKNDRRVDAWAAWRGLRKEVVRWAAERRLLAEKHEYRERREAFLIQRWNGDREELEDMGWHVRLAPGTLYHHGGTKPEWRYSRRGIGAWPFVVLPSGGVERAKFIFFTEGQWDALALIDLMGWEARWPESVAVFGLRGATSMLRCLEFPIMAEARAFLIADRDAAGEKWFVGPECFAETLRKRVRMVYAFWPIVPGQVGKGVKDLNDALKCMDARDREINAACLRSRVRRKGKVQKKPTFLKWLRLWKDDETERGQFAAWVTHRASGCPKGRAQKPVWVRWIQATKMEDLPIFERCWTEWRDA